MRRVGLDAVQPGHPDVHHDHVGVQVGGLGDGVGAVLGQAHDLDAGLGVEEDGEALADHGLVIGDEHADRHGWPSFAVVAVSTGTGSRTETS